MNLQAEGFTRDVALAAETTVHTICQTGSLNPQINALNVSNLRPLAASVTKGKNLQVVHGRTSIRLVTSRHPPQHVAGCQAPLERRKVIDAAIQVVAYLYKNDNHRINQRLEDISACLPFPFFLSSALIDWPWRN